MALAQGRGMKKGMLILLDKKVLRKLEVQFRWQLCGWVLTRYVMYLCDVCVKAPISYFLHHRHASTHRRKHPRKHPRTYAHALRHTYTRTHTDRPARMHVV